MVATIDHPRMETALKLETVTQLLQDGDYDAAAQWLFETQQEYQESFGTSLVGTLIGMTQQICLLLSRCSAEIEWYRVAHGDVQTREVALRQQLYIMLKLAGELARSHQPSSAVVIEKPSLPADKIGGGLGVWQQLVSILKRQETPIAVPPPATRPITIEPAPITPVPTQLEGQRLVIYNLGSFEVYRNDHLITAWESRKAMAILKYLLIHHPQPIHKERLMDVFWRDVGQDTARNNLNVAICALRKALRGKEDDFSHILFRDDCYLLNPDLHLWMAHEVFQSHADAGRKALQAGDSSGAISDYEAAVMLYMGGLFGDNDYEDWSQGLGKGLQDTFLSILHQLSAHYLEVGDLYGCTSTCNRLLTIEPADETVHARLIRCYGRQRQPLLAMRQYERCLLALRELGVKPSAEMGVLMRAVRAGESL